MKKLYALTLAGAFAANTAFPSAVVAQDQKKIHKKDRKKNGTGSAAKKDAGK